jgi:hypothetical protein
LERQRASIPKHRNSLLQVVDYPPLRQASELGKGMTGKTNDWAREWLGKGMIGQKYEWAEK